VNWRDRSWSIPAINNDPRTQEESFIQTAVSIVGTRAHFGTSAGGVAGEKFCEIREAISD